MSEGIIVFRIQLLPRSETFIVTQAAAMQRFKPYFVGWREVEGIEIPEHRRWTANSGGLWGRARELRFRYLSPTREDMARLRRRSPRLVYAHFALDGFAAMGLAKRLGVPLVTALHGYDVTMNDEAISATRLGREYLKGRKRLQSEGALFVACSAYVRSRAIERGYPPDRTIVHSIGVDVEQFSPPPGTRREPVVLFVGRLVEKKGCKVLVEAMAEVQDRCPEAELVVIGDGPMRAACETTAAMLHIRCRFLRSQPPAVVQDWMARAKIFCVPSLVAPSGDAEGFGIVFIEAQAMGLPVVSTLSGGIPEAVEDKQTGLLVAEDEPKALAEAIVTLLHDEKLWKRFSLAGRERVLDGFNLARQTRRLENVFGDVLSRRRAIAEYRDNRLAPKSISASKAPESSLRGAQVSFSCESLNRSDMKIDKRANGGFIN